MVQSDAALVFSDIPPEPARAEWLAEKLTEQGLSIVNYQYPGEANLLELLRESQTQARKVIVLFCRTTATSACSAFVEFSCGGYKPLPVRCESYEKPPMMADLSHADIFGLNVAKDVRQVTELVRAIG